MGQYRYVTNRTVENNAGKPEGRIKVLVPQDSENADVDYICPECGNSDKLQQVWKRPFNVKCSKCGFLIKLPRLKDEIKKDKKRAKKKR